MKFSFTNEIVALKNLSFLTPHFTEVCERCHVKFIGCFLSFLTDARYRTDTR